MGRAYVFEPAKTEHVDGISRVIREAISQVNAKDYPPAEIERLLRNFSERSVRALLGQRQTLVALLEGRVVGTAALQGCEVKSVFVSPYLHRTGIGSSLMRELERIARRQGIASLDVSSSLSAVPFYAALGYVEKERTFFGDEETVLMRKTLGNTPPD
ncbi:GNAT family N-acetyltransferase [Hasllibacter sp. MH4015]|uniref:GNAT family N-acetyltransferase n=1 Tax=Hasllibacter sp. MH4015 TaxID=2854029 RepID=UPI001CD1AC0A|nr:GNAT family N-acetyltransferase [Hasllibacter sp. MH4015]